MWSFEKKYVASDEVDAGPLSEKWLTLVWLALFGGMVGLLALHHTLICSFSDAQALLFVPFALVFARLAALDLCYLLLLNIYTVPLFISGIACHFFLPGMSGISWQESLLGGLVAAGLGVLLTFVITLFNKQQGEFGFGDVKMLAVMGVWVGLTALPFALALGFIANLVLSFFISGRHPMPFGFGLVLGTWVMVAFKQPFMEMLFYLAT